MYVQNTINDIGYNFVCYRLRTVSNWGNVSYAMIAVSDSMIFISFTRRRWKVGSDCRR